MDFEIRSVQAPKVDNANFLGKVSFAFVPSRLQPLRITSSYKPDGEDAYRDRIEAEIDGAAVVRVNTAFLKRSKNGDYYVNVPSGIDLPWDLSKAIGAAAWAQLEAARHPVADQAAARRRSA